MRGELAMAFTYLSIATASAAAQSPLQVPVDIETVASGGFWEVNDSTHGQFRVVVETGGLEHLISTAQIDWIAEPVESDTPPRLVATAAIPEVTVGGVHLVDPVMVRDGTRWILTIDAVNTHCDPARIDRWRVALGPPGTLTVLGSTPVQPGCN